MSCTSISASFDNRRQQSQHPPEQDMGMSCLCRGACLSITKLCLSLSSCVGLVRAELFKEEEELLQQNPDNDSAGGTPRKHPSARKSKEGISKARMSHL